MAKSSQGLKQQQQQQMRLNQRQMMLGRLLEMSPIEFEEEIVRALEENPALTVIDPADAPQPEHDDSDDDDFGDGLLYNNRRGNGPDFQRTAASSSEAEAVEQQLADLDLSEIERETAHYIIGNLDSSGYLTRNAAAIADDMATTAGIEVPQSVVEKMIKVVKSLDPAGIGAENLRECLLIQLSRMPQSPVVKLASDIIAKHYKSFVNNRIDLIRDLSSDPAMLEAAVKLIRSLNPKPGAGLFDHDVDDRTRHISPDFIIDVDDSGRATVSLAGMIPELAVESSFMLEDVNPADSKAAEFIKERREGAEEFIDGVRRRGSTLLAIMRAIMTLQPEFFRSFEPEDLRPMVIRDIEELTGLDKSVISRATSTKYMLTPDGIFSLKGLFGESASSTSDLSAREVESLIQRLVDQEDKEHPLSDDELTDALNSKGMAVARRTVAKYRERLGIPVSRLRRKTI